MGMQDFFYCCFARFGWYLCRRSSHLKNAQINHCKNNNRLEMINLFHSTNLSLLLYHSSVFFIFPLKEAVYLRSFGGMSEYNIYSSVFNTHTYKDTLFIAIYMCFIM